MKWNISVQELARRGRVVLYRAVADDGDWDGFRQPLEEFVIVLAKALQDEYHGGLEPDWDVIYCEMWPDSGRLIGYPGLRTRARRIEHVVVQVSLPTVEQEYYRLSETPTEFERQHSQLMRRLAGEIGQAAGSAHAAARLAELNRWHPAEVRILWYDDDLPDQTVVLAP